MAFRVGQKVVCIDAGETSKSMHGALLVGGIYTVREVATTLSGRRGIKVVGYEYSCWPWQVGRKTHRTFEDSPMWAERFRPLVERKTDISVFTKMLTPQGVDA